MHLLELKVPPPIVALLIGSVMWFFRHLGPSLPLPPFVSIVGAVAIAVCGGGVALAGSLSFRRAKTTVNPLRPEKASSLVTSGIYRFTRNPMYLGLLLVLVGWALRLSSLLVFAGPLLFLFYMRRFQIVPEERVLFAKFGQTYSDYRAQVRRWL